MAAQVSQDRGAAPPQDQAPDHAQEQGGGQLTDPHGGGPGAGMEPHPQDKEAEQYLAHHEDEHGGRDAGRPRHSEEGDVGGEVVTAGPIVTKAAEVKPRPTARVEVRLGPSV